MHKLIVLLAVVLLLAGSSVSAQSPIKLGVGAYGGLSIPVLQTDQGNGTAFGFKIRWALGSLFVVEPNFNFDKWGKPGSVGVLSGSGDTTFDLGTEGSKVTSFGVDLVVGNSPGAIGLKPYFVAGVASYKVKNDDTGYDESGFGWSGGLGVGIGLSPKFGLDIRGKLLVAPQDGGSKKGLDIVGGINYNFGGGY